MFSNEGRYFGSGDMHILINSQEKSLIYFGIVTLFPFKMSPIFTFGTLPPVRMKKITTPKE